MIWAEDEGESYTTITRENRKSFCMNITKFERAVKEGSERFNRPISFPENEKAGSFHSFL